MAKIRTVADRGRLKPRPTPYFQVIATGSALGFRKWNNTTSGTWVARWRDPDTGKQHHHPLGSFDDLPANERYDQALKLARNWWNHVQHGGATQALTVKDACDLYAESLEREGRDRAAADIRRRFDQYVNNHPISTIELSVLQPRHIERWRIDLQAIPTRAGRTRSATTLNRDMVCLKAALNFALEKRLLTTNIWQSELKPIKGASKRRDLYLDAEQRQRLIDAAREDLQPFLRALCSLPLRVGAMAALTVGDYNARLKTIKVREDKAGAGRQIALPAVTAKFFKDATRDKLPNAPLFSRYDGAPWIKDKYKHAFKDAVQTAELPPETVAYTLRHSCITDLIVAGADPMTVAQISGTSLMMIQRHYGHLTPAAASAALETLAI